ncbi:hypothetical protein [Streptomyces sp. NPDC008240]|uniref:hypothetical protein n=1 Tax=Streptomyces sp. NPDC008240 TaxID=3364822 RepID=UPI0036E70F4A
MPEHCKSRTARKTVRAQYVFSDELPPGCPPVELPDGCMMMEVELDDLTLLVLRPGSMDRRLLDELNRYADRVTSLGIWSRDPSRVGALQAVISAARR